MPLPATSDYLKKDCIVKGEIINILFRFYLLFLNLISRRFRVGRYFNTVVL